jgi:ABC-2 type transport system permease protein
MKKYFLVMKLAAQDLFQYKLDFFLSVTKYAISISLLAIVWLNVEKSGQVGAFTPQQTITYFLLSAMLYSLSNFHPYYIEEDIRYGYLSRYLVKPMSVTIYYICFELTRVSIETISKMVVFFSLLFWFHLLPDFSLAHLAIVITYSPFIFLFAFQWLMIVSQLSFWITEAYALRWTVTLLMRLLSGLLIPMIYFPEMVQQIFFYLPFQHLAYTPITFMLGKLTLPMFAKSFLVLLCWTMIVTLLRRWMWYKGVRSYEGTGI